MLAGNVVTAAIREASLREQIAAPKQVIALQARQLTSSSAWSSSGGCAQIDVVRQRAGAGAHPRAALPDVAASSSNSAPPPRRATPAGRRARRSCREFRLAELQLPAELPLACRRELARQRPDIRAAEALLQQAGARVGVATANLYPQITLSATGGSLARAAPATCSSAAPASTCSARRSRSRSFTAASCRRKRRAAVAAYEQAGGAYREVVLQGFQNVADVLRALEADAQKLTSAPRPPAQARSYHDIVAARYKAGGVSHYALLDAQRQLTVTLLDAHRPSPTAMPIPPRCCRRSAAAGGSRSRLRVRRRRDALPGGQRRHCLHNCQPIHSELSQRQWRSATQPMPVPPMAVPAPASSAASRRVPALRRCSCCPMATQCKARSAAGARVVRLASTCRRSTSAASSRSWRRCAR